MKKSLIIVFSIFEFFINVISSQAADFTLPNSSGEPIVIDISNLNVTSSIDVTLGSLTDQPRPYRDDDTKSLIIFPPPLPNSEQSIQVSAGGSTVSKTISFRPSPSGILKSSLLPESKAPKGGNTVTKISDGRIVLIGGSMSLANSSNDLIEIFDPNTGRSEFLKTPDELEKAKLKTPRSQHTATHIGISNAPIGMIVNPVEQILVVGGFSKDGLLETTIEIVEIKVGTLQGTSTLLSGKKSKLKKARIFHSANLLPDGRILIIGGQGRINQTSLGALNSIEIFDPVTKSVQPAGFSLSIPRLLHTATILQDGNILITGGFTNEKQNEFRFGPATPTAELIDSSQLTIKNIGTLVNNEGIGGHSATVLTNGLVLIFGGNSDFFSTRTEDEIKGISKGTVQFYNPNNESFNITRNKLTGGTLELQTPRFLHQSILLPNGNIAVIGGQNIKAGLNTTSLISSPISLIEVFNPDILTFSSNSSTLEIGQKTNLESSVARILPTAILVTPKDKTQGFLSNQDKENFVNSAIYITGGFTNGFGKLPTKVSEFIQVESNTGIEGRGIKLTPEAVIQGSYIGQFLIELDKFSKVPSIKVEPQTVNLSSSNSFMANVKVLTNNNEFILLKAENNDLSNPIVISPSLFQAGETVSITRKADSVLGEFEIRFLVADTTKSFLEAKLKVNVSDSAKPFLSTVPGHGISLSNEAGLNTENIQLKVFSQDGLNELTTIPSTTQVTATISDPLIANLGSTGVSSVTGNLLTQFSVNGVKPGKTSLNFSINFGDVLGISIPIEISGTPSFSSNPIDSTVLTNLSSNGVDFSRTVKLNSTSVFLEDLRLVTSSILFPFYVPINLQSSVNSTAASGLFTIRPIFGIDLLTSIPRTLVNSQATDFRENLTFNITSIGGIVPANSSNKPIAILASNDGIRSLTYGKSSSEPLNESLIKINDLSNVKDLELFEFRTNGGKDAKIVVLKSSMIFLLNADSGDVETSSNISDTGFELELTRVDNKDAVVASCGLSGIDLVFGVTDSEPRKVNFKLSGSTRNITVVEKLGSVVGPFAVAYDGNKTLSIVNLLNVDEAIKTINAGTQQITKIDYGGRFNLNGKLTDVLVATAQRKVFLFDLNNLVNIPINADLKIKSQIEDLVVIDGVAYLALGKDGILAVSIGSLITSSDGEQEEITTFKKNKLTVIKPSGKQEIKTKGINAKKLANSKPFLLATGEGNDLTVIRVSP